MELELTHEQIEQEDYCHRYVTQQLDDASLELFELHFATCNSCMDNITWEEGLQAEICAAVEAGHITAPGTPEEPGKVVSIESRRKRRRFSGLLALAASLPLFLLLPPWIYYVVTHQNPDPIHLAEASSFPPVVWQFGTDNVRAAAETMFYLPEQEEARVVMQLEVNQPYYSLLLHNEAGTQVGQIKGQTVNGQAQWEMKKLSPGIYDLTLNLSVDGQAYHFEVEHRFEAIDSSATP